MNIETLQSISRYAYLIGGILLAISVILFILFDIPKLFNEITGRATKRFIADTNRKNEAMIQEQEKKSAHAASGQLVSSGLLTNGQNGTVPKVMTTKLISQSEVKKDLFENPVQQNNAETKFSVVNPDVDFCIVQEFHFTSSTEIIE